MIHEAYMPVYMGSRFLARDGRTDGGSTRGPRGPKKSDLLIDKPPKWIVIVIKCRKALLQQIYNIEYRIKPKPYCRTFRKLWVIDFKFKYFWREYALRKSFSSIYYISNPCCLTHFFSRNASHKVRAVCRWQGRVLTRCGGVFETFIQETVFFLLQWTLFDHQPERGWEVVAGDA